MAIEVRYRVPVDGVKHHYPNTGVLMRSVTIVNQSGDALTFSTQWDSYTVPSGNVETYDITSTQQFDAQTASNTTGEAYILLSDGPANPQALAKSLSAQIANFPATQNVNIVGTPNVAIASGTVNVGNILQAVIQAGLVTINNPQNQPVYISNTNPAVQHIVVSRQLVGIAVLKNVSQMSIFLKQCTSPGLLSITRQPVATDSVAITDYLVREASINTPTFNNDPPPPWIFSRVFLFNEQILFNFSGIGEFGIIY